MLVQRRQHSRWSNRGEETLTPSNSSCSFSVGLKVSQVGVEGRSRKQAHFGAHGSGHLRSGFAPEGRTRGGRELSLLALVAPARLLMGLACISLRASQGGHVVMCVLAIRVSSAVKHVFRYLPII